MKKIVLCGVIYLLLVVLTICIINKDDKALLKLDEQNVTWEEFKSNLDFGKVKFIRNESDHDLLYKCACGTLAIFPKDIGYCTCQMIEITCKEHGIIVENDPRRSCS